jgi:hypothetical protein
MQRYIKGIVVVVAMACGMSAIGAEGDAVIGAEADAKASKDFSIRIAGGSVPGIDEADIDGFGTVSLDDETGGRLEVLAVKRFFGKNDSAIGGMFGGGIFFSGQSGEAGGSEVTLSAFGGMIQGGMAIKLGQNWVVEFGPYLGLGVAETELTGFDDGTGPYAFLGVKAGVFVGLGDSVELGLELGYEGFSQEQEFEGFGGNVDVTFSGSGPRLAAVLAFKF